MLAAECSEKAGQDHGYISQNGNKDVGSAQIGKQRKVEKYERSGQSPIDVASPVDLAVDVLIRGWDMDVLLTDADVVESDARASSHGEVREGCNDGDHGGDDVVETFGLCIVRLNLEADGVNIRLEPAMPCQ